MKNIIPFLFLLALSYSCKHEENLSDTLGKIISMSVLITFIQRYLFYYKHVFLCQP